MTSPGGLAFLLAGLLALGAVRPSASLYERPGRCPTPPKDIVTNCLAKCEEDAECPWPQKCCNWACMRDCFDPVYDICQQPLDPGPCLSLVPRYHYNPASKMCEKFSYGGCKGNKNNFKTLKACLKACKGTYPETECGADDGGTDC